ncbi:MAG: flavodoxin domain-containing protein [Halobacteriota archaeon]
MSKILVVYESKYGNTKRVAETIVQGMRQVEGIDPTLSDITGVDPNTILNYDAIVIGGPNHMGGPTRGVKKFIDKIGKLSLADKKFAVFDTYGGGDFEKATKKMEQRMHEKAPAMKAVAPGLSIKVDGMKGPISEGELPKCEEFGAQIAMQLKAAT